MNKRITTSIFAATLGLTLMAGAPANAMNGEGDMPEGCVVGSASTIVVITPETTEQRLVSPAVEEVTKTEYEFIHKNEDHPQSPRWEAEGWNSDDNESSLSWTATGESRVVIVTPAVDAIYETVTIPAVTEEHIDHYLDCPEVPAEETPTEEQPPTEEVEVPADNEIPADEQPATEPVIELEVEVTPAGAPLAQVGGEVKPQGAVVTATTPTSSTEELAHTGAADWALPLGLGGVALAGGIAVLALNRRRAAVK